MSWMWIEHAATMQFIGILFNTFVHVVMYYYFYLKSVKIEPVWKKYVTSLQIIQFVTSLVCFGFTMYLVHIQQESCRAINILYGSILFNITLLYGFINVLLSGSSKAKGKIP
jgi:hypothetical protein